VGAAVDDWSLRSRAARVGSEFACHLLRDATVCGSLRVPAANQLGSRWWSASAMVLTKPNPTKWSIKKVKART